VEQDRFDDHFLTVLVLFVLLIIVLKLQKQQ
jgi:hypothetical protein